jgi:hypothetical protein
VRLADRAHRFLSRREDANVPSRRADRGVAHAGVEDRANRPLAIGDGALSAPTLVRAAREILLWAQRGRFCPHLRVTLGEITRNSALSWAPSIFASREVRRGLPAAEPYLSSAALDCFSAWSSVLLSHWRRTSVLTLQGDVATNISPARTSNANKHRHLHEKPSG